MLLKQYTFELAPAHPGPVSVAARNQILMPDNLYLKVVKRVEPEILPPVEEAELPSVEDAGSSSSSVASSASVSAAPSSASLAQL